ncbi:DoxX-like family protein [Paenibacillus swuensis]|uniref:DoxX-like family protein n=1 Tax=Paenibacillus swuensis TaxID=1178515 RepID=A0A172TDT6_9BACL|nr:DoxX family protein [Paenibacillus swuensis]ANE45199.1 DoxX-like family protein [Paenibacillus swuensis]
MRKQTILYWIFTSIVILLMGVGSIPNIISSPQSVELMEHLGYQPYLLPFLGVAKLLGVLAILIPGYPRIKEWAYAGFVFDLTGAMYSTIAVGDINGGLIVFIVGYIAVAGSYIYYHKRLKASSTQFEANVGLNLAAK